MDGFERMENLTSDTANKMALPRCKIVTKSCVMTGSTNARLILESKSFGVRSLPVYKHHGNCMDACSC